MTSLPSFHRGSESIKFEKIGSMDQGLIGTLPFRNLGAFRHAGWFIIGAIIPGSLFAWNILNGIRVLIGDLWTKDPNGNIHFDPLAIALTIIFTLGTAFAFHQVLRLIFFGFSILQNQTFSQIIIQGSQIKCIERAGLGKFQRKLKNASKIRSLEISTGIVSTADKSVSISDDNSVSNDSPTLGEWGYHLRAILDNGTFFTLAAYYPRETLELLQTAIAENLVASDRLGLAPRRSFLFPIVDSTDVSSFGTSRLRSDEQGLGEDADLSRIEEIVSVPSETKVQFETRDDGLTIRIPSMGLIKGSYGLFFFAIIWNTFITLFISLWICSQLGWIQNNAKNEGGLVATGVLGLFLFIGIGMMLMSIYLGTRRSVVATSYGMLLVSTESIFGKNTKQWEREQIKLIDVGPSGIEVNDRPVMQLQIREINGNVFGALSQLNVTELHWIAQSLRNSLEIQNASRNDVSASIINNTEQIVDRPIPISGSKIEFEESRNGWSLVANPRRRGSDIVGTAIGFILVCIGIGVPLGALLAGNRDFSFFAFMSIWSSGFVAMGVFFTYHNLKTGFSRYRVNSDSSTITVKIESPFSTKAISYTAGNDLEVRIEKSKIQQKGVEPAYYLAIGEKGTNKSLILTSWPLEEIEFARNWILFSLRDR